MKDYNAWYEENYKDIPLNPPGSILADNVYFLHHFIMKHKPKNIIEFGSGVSTAILIRLANTYGGVVYSLEHHEGWVQGARELCENAGISNHNIIHAPLVEFKIEGVEKFRCHEIKNLPDIMFDFAFIDAPPGFKKEHAGRRGTLLSIWDKMNSKSWALLDDADRSGEQNAAIEWMIKYNTQLSASFLNFEKAEIFFEINKESSGFDDFLRKLKV